MDDGGAGTTRWTMLAVLLLVCTFSPTHARAEESSDVPRRYQPDVLPGDLAAGPTDAPVTVVALVRLPDGAAAPLVGALLRLAARADDENVRVLVRPRVDETDGADVRRARLFFALPDDRARLRWLGELLGAGADAWRAAERLAPRATLVQRGNDTTVDRRLEAVLQEQLRLQVGPRDAVYVNGLRLDADAGEGELRLALGQAQRTAREEGGRVRQAEEIGPRRLPGATPAGPEGALDLTLFVDWRDPHSRRLAGHVVALLDGSELADRLRVRLATLALERHPDALTLGALARCLSGWVAPARVLEAFYGDAYQRADVSPDALCDALALPVATCAWMKGCSALPSTASGVLAEGAEARAAGADAPPALFLDGRRVVPHGRGFSRAFLEDVLLGYHLRTWTLPPDGRLE